MSKTVEQRRSLRPVIGLLAGPLIFSALLLSPPPEGLSPTAWSVAAMAALMVVWWVTEALPVSATALVPIVALPLSGVMDVGQATAPYANPVIFLFLGGMLIAKAVERWDLHRRIALNVLRAVGPAPDRVMAGFMVATAFLSMWLSNTATTIMMLPIAISVIDLLGHRPSSPGADKFAIALLLGIAYAASIGGLGTLIGTPPNALLAGFMAEEYGIQIGFAQWMALGVPLAALLLVLSWLLLTRVVFRVDHEPVSGVTEMIFESLTELGAMSRAERRVAAVFVIVALLWVLRPVLNGLLPGFQLTDTVIAMAGGLSLFLIPVNLREGHFLLDWQSASTIPWGVLVLFGGGLSLAEAMQKSGLSAWISDILSAYGALPLVGLILLVIALVVFLTEITSNTATSSLFIPIAATLGSGISGDPMLLAVPVALAASCAFMLPVATPPNAIVYSSGWVPTPQMAKSGLALNVICILVLTAAVYATAGWLLGQAVGQ